MWLSIVCDLKMQARGKEKNHDEHELSMLN